LQHLVWNIGLEFMWMQWSSSHSLCWCINRNFHINCPQLASVSLSTSVLRLTHSYNVHYLLP